MGANNSGNGYAAGNLAGDIARLRDDTDALMGDMPNVPRELKNRLQSLQDQVADLYALVAKDAAHTVDAVEESIQARPWTAAIAAIGLGFIIGLILQPRR